MAAVETSATTSPSSLTSPSRLGSHSSASPSTTAYTHGVSTAVYQIYVH